MPGTLKICSMRNDPVMRPAVTGPTIVATGIIAFFITWLTTTTCSRSPLLRAVRT